MSKIDIKGISNLRRVKKADCILITVLEGDGTKENIYREVTRAYIDGVLFDIEPVCKQE